MSSFDSTSSLAIPSSQPSPARPKSRTLIHLPDEIIVHIVKIGCLAATDILSIRWTCSSLYERSGGIFGDDCADRARRAADALEGLSSDAARPCRIDARDVREALEEAASGEEKMKAFCKANRAVQHAAVRLGGARDDARRALRAAARSAPRWFFDLVMQANRDLLPADCPYRRGASQGTPVDLAFLDTLSVTIAMNRRTFKDLAVRNGTTGRSAEFTAADNLNVAIQSFLSMRKDCASFVVASMRFDFGSDSEHERRKFRMRDIIMESKNLAIDRQTSASAAGDEFVRLDEEEAAFRLPYVHLAFDNSHSTSAPSSMVYQWLDSTLVHPDLAHAGRRLAESLQEMDRCRSTKNPERRKNSSRSAL